MLAPRQASPDDSRHWTPESDDSPQSWKASLATSTVIPCVVTFAVIALVICLLSLRFYVICRRGYSSFSWRAFFVPRSGIACLGVDPPPPPPPRLSNSTTSAPRRNRSRFRIRPTTSGPSIGPGGRRLDRPDPDDHWDHPDAENADVLPEYKRIDTSLPLYTPPLHPEPVYSLDPSYQHAATSRNDLLTSKADDSLDNDNNTPQHSNSNDNNDNNHTSV